MKVFVKLYLGMMVLMVLSLLTSSYFVVKTTLDRNLRHEIENGLTRHNMLLTSFENNLIIVTRNQNIDDEKLKNVISMTKGMNDLSLIVFVDDMVKYNNTDINLTPEYAEEEYVKYEKVIQGDRTYISYYSCFTKRNVKYTFISLTDITSVLDENNSLRHQFFIIYLVVLLCGTVFSLILALHLTKPIKRLRDASERIANGDYSVRITKTSKDEIGELTDVYNTMSETIQEKIDALELSAKQKEDFIAAFAHETKTPMTSIIGYGDLIYQNKLSEKDRCEAAEIIVNEGMRLQALSLKLLDMIGLNKNSIMKEEINTSEMAVDIENTIKMRLENKSISASFSFEEDYINVDYDLFKTVIINLIDNSIKANSSKVKILGLRNDQEYVITVSDDGMGIPESELSRVKEAFYMVDKSRSRKEHGAGLGLALCDKIISLHNGHMDIDSVLGEGTTVSIYL